jgi:hypothetical protein
MKRAIPIILLAFISMLSVTGCIEPRYEHGYYREHHEHSEAYYHRHPNRHPGVEVEFHN